MDHTVSQISSRAVLALLEAQLCHDLTDLSIHWSLAVSDSGFSAYLSIQESRTGKTHQVMLVEIGQVPLSLPIPFISVLGNNHNGLPIANIMFWKTQSLYPWVYL